MRRKSWRKSSLIFPLLFLLAGAVICFSRPVQASDPVYRYVSERQSNVRSEASETDDNIVTTLYGNTRVEWLYDEDEWCYVSYGENQNGFIWNQNLSETRQNTEGTAKWALCPLKLYAEPLSTCEEKQSISFLQEVEDRGVFFNSPYRVIFYEGRDWYLLNADKLLSDTQEPKTATKYVVSDQYSQVNIRAEAAWDAPVLTTVYANKKVECFCESGGWAYICFDGDQYGFIGSDLLTEQPPVVEGEEKYITQPALALYADPTLACPNTRVVPYGTPLLVGDSFFNSSFRMVSLEGEIWYVYKGESAWGEAEDIDPAVQESGLFYVGVDYVALFPASDPNSENILVPYRTPLRYTGDDRITPEGLWIQMEKGEELWYLRQGSGASGGLVTAVPSLESYTSDNPYVQEVIDKALYYYAERQTDYVGGGMGEEDEAGVVAFDCCGFLKHIMVSIMQQYIPVYNFRSVVPTMFMMKALYNEGLPGEYLIEDVALEDIQPGDLVFFKNYLGKALEDEEDDDIMIAEYGYFASHVGLYLGQGDFIHADNHGSCKGIGITKLDAARLSDYLIGARRFIPAYQEEFPTANVSRYIATAQTNLYTEASSDSPVKRVLYGNTPITVLMVNNSWTYAEVEGKRGLIWTVYTAEEAQNTEGEETWTLLPVTLFSEPTASCGETLALGYGVAVEERGQFFDTRYHVMVWEGGIWYLYDAEQKLGDIQEQQDQAVTRYVHQYRANVRSEDNTSTEDNIVARLYGNTPVKSLFETTGGWSFICFGEEQYGFIDTGFLAESPENTEGELRGVISASVMYGEPNSESAAKTDLPLGAVVEDRGAFYGTAWQVVAHEGGIWYLYNGAQKLGEPTGEERYIKGFRINVREEASSQSPVAVRLHGNTPVEWLFDTGGWSCIRYGENQIGFIGREYLGTEPQNQSGSEKKLIVASATLYQEPNDSAAKRTVPYGILVEDRGSFYNTRYHVVAHEGSIWYLYDAEQKLGDPDALPVYKYVKGNSINVRAQASSGAQLVTRLPGNYQVEWLCAVGGWSYICYGQNQYGYMASEYLTDSLSPKTRYIKGSSVNVRTQASSVAQLVTKLPGNYEVDWLYNLNGWSYILFNGDQFGFVGAELLLSAPVPKTKYVKGNSVNVRDRASSQGALLTKLSGNTPVEWLYNQNGWSYIRFNGDQYGYVGAELLLDVQATKIKYVKGGSVNVRAEASSKSAILTKLVGNTQVEWVYDSNGWSCIRFGNNQTGFIGREYLTDTAGPIYRYVKGSSVNVRAEASSKSAIVTKLAGNTKVEWISSANGWSYIKFADGQMGYIGSEFLLTAPQN